MWFGNNLLWLFYRGMYRFFVEMWSKKVFGIFVECRVWVLKMLVVGFEFVWGNFSRFWVYCFNYLVKLMYDYVGDWI